MNRFGTRLSLILYWTLQVVALLLLLAGLVGVLLIALGTLDPGAFASLGDPAAAPVVGTVILGAAVVAGLILWQLIGLLRSAADGEPFVLANVRRLRIAAAGLAFAAFAGPLAALLLPSAVADGAIDGGSLLGALLALVLAEVFRAGVALREDAEGTV